jgi:hypothetical protein
MAIRVFVLPSTSFSPFFFSLIRQCVRPSTDMDELGNGSQRKRRADDPIASTEGKKRGGPKHSEGTYLTSVSHVVI